jgi:hypothetical protein
LNNQSSFGRYFEDIEEGASGKARLILSPEWIKKYPNEHEVGRKWLSDSTDACIE